MIRKTHALCSANPSSKFIRPQQNYEKARRNLFAYAVSPMVSAATPGTIETARLADVWRRHCAVLRLDHGGAYVAGAIHSSSRNFAQSMDAAGIRRVLAAAHHSCLCS